MKRQKARVEMKVAMSVEKVLFVLLLAAIAILHL
jgi:hypothetical protein